MFEISLKNVPKFSRPLNSGMVDRMSIQILVNRAGASSMGAAVAGAVARHLLSVYRSSLANSLSVTFAVPFQARSRTRSFALPSSAEVLQKTLTSRSPSLRNSRDSSLSVMRNPKLQGTYTARNGLDGAGDVSLQYIVCVCVFFPSILDIKFVGRTSRGHTGGRSHRIFNPPSFCGACLDFCREKDSAIPFLRRP